jgi:hypothetical protein
VRVESLRVQLRPRSGWEAVDLGFVMAREWWKPLWGAWLAAYLPLAAALTFAFADKPIYAALILWWLKPAFDRAALHVLARAVFGETATARSALTSRELLRPGLLYALTIGRLSLARSFMMPVAQLEQLSGGAARERRAALSRRERGYAVGLTSACATFELALLLGIGMLADLLTPAAGTVAPDLAAWLGGSDGTQVWWSMADGIAYVIAVSVVEPLYVAGGFAVYLNRRTLLEGWDIEVALRRLSQRVLSATRRAAMFAAAAITIAVAGAPPADAADPAGEAPQQAVREVLRAPEFAQYRDAMQWQYRGERKPPPEPQPQVDSSGFESFLRFVAEVVERLGWVLAAIAVVAALYVAWRYARRYEPRPEEARYHPPETLFGLAVAPETLPDDVAGAALAAARSGRLREALSLLYRGALSALVHRHEIRLAPGDTEGDCVRLAGGALDVPAAGYFARLVGDWQHAAYAGRDPQLARVEALADEWRRHFGSTPA